LLIGQKGAPEGLQSGPLEEEIME